MENTFVNSLILVHRRWQDSISAQMPVIWMHDWLAWNNKEADRSKRGITNQGDLNFVYKQFKNLYYPIRLFLSCLLVKLFILYHSKWLTLKANPLFSEESSFQEEIIFLDCFISIHVSILILARRYPFTVLIICSNFFLYSKYKQDPDAISSEVKDKKGEFFSRSIRSMLCPRNEFELYLNTFLLLYVGRRYETIFHSWNFLNMLFWCFVFTTISRLPGQTQVSKEEPYINSNIFSISISCCTALWMIAPYRTMSRIVKFSFYFFAFYYLFSSERDYDLRQGLIVGGLMKNIFLLRYNLYAWM